MTKYLRAIFDAPVLFNEIIEHVKAGTLTEDCVVSIGWLVIEVIKGGDEAAIRAKQCPKVKEFVEHLKTPKVLAIKKQLETLLSSSHENQNMSFQTIEDRIAENAGWRHSNDKVDFHEIEIYPTLDEIMCSEPSFLPKTDELFKSNVPLAGYLEWCFRLLREDIVHTVTEEVRTLLHSKGSSNLKELTKLRSRSIQIQSFELHSRTFYA